MARFSLDVHLNISNLCRMKLSIFGLSPTTPDGTRLPPRTFGKCAVNSFTFHRTSRQSFDTCSRGQGQVKGTSANVGFGTCPNFLTSPLNIGNMLSYRYLLKWCERNPKMDHLTNPVRTWYAVSTVFAVHLPWISSDFLILWFASQPRFKLQVIYCTTKFHNTEDGCKVPRHFGRCWTFHYNSIKSTEFHHVS